MSRFEFKFDAEVFGHDKQCGRLDKLVVDPTSWELKSFVIARGLLFTQTMVIPVSKFFGIRDQVVYLDMNCEELSDFPEFHETVVEKGVTEWFQPSTNPLGTEPYSTLPGVPDMTVVRERIRIGVPDELLLLDLSTTVKGLEDKIGQLNYIITSNNFQISHIVATQGKLLPRLLMIPISLVETISESDIYVHATNAEVKEFSEFVALEGDSMT